MEVIHVLDLKSFFLKCFRAPHDNSWLIHVHCSVYFYRVARLSFRLIIWSKMIMWLAKMFEDSNESVEDTNNGIVMLGDSVLN